MTKFEVAWYQIINLCSTLIVIVYITVFLKVRPKKYAFYTSIICAVIGIAGTRILWICSDINRRLNYESIFDFKYGSMDLGGAFKYLI